MVFGREWWYAIHFDIFGESFEKVQKLDVPFDLNYTLNNVAIDFKDIFEDCNVLLKNVLESISMKKDVKPIFCRHRNVVYALHNKVDEDVCLPQVFMKRQIL